MMDTLAEALVGTVIYAIMAAGLSYTVCYGYTGGWPAHPWVILLLASFAGLTKGAQALKQ